MTDAGLKAAVAPLGIPEMVRSTVCGLPFVSAVETVLEPEVPCSRVRLVGSTEIVKSSTGPQLGNLNEAIRVCQLKEPSVRMYSEVYQKVQSSIGSTAIML